MNLVETEQLSDEEQFDPSKTVVSLLLDEIQTPEDRINAFVQRLKCDPHSVVQRITDAAKKTGGEPRLCNMVENLDALAQSLQSIDDAAELSAISKSLSKVAVEISIDIQTIDVPTTRKILTDIVRLISEYADLAAHRELELEPTKKIGGAPGDKSGGLNATATSRLLSMMTQIKTGIVVLDDDGSISLVVNGRDVPQLQRGLPLPKFIADALPGVRTDAALDYMNISIFGTDRNESGDVTAFLFTVNEDVA
ncbi:MAG: hypothetical protein QF773_00060 [Lentisphaeria bacterium]|jgi:hypothetical protein|nr:hypothetical protein [Lentisphaeria bacterium]